MRRECSVSCTRIQAWSIMTPYRKEGGHNKLSPLHRVDAPIVRECHGKICQGSLPLVLQLELYLELRTLRSGGNGKAGCTIGYKGVYTTVAVSMDTAHGARTKVVVPSTKPCLAFCRNDCNRCMASNHMAQSEHDSRVAFTSLTFDELMLMPD